MYLLTFSHSFMRRHDEKHKSLMKRETRNAKRVHDGLWLSTMSGRDINYHELVMNWP